MQKLKWFFTIIMMLLFLQHQLVASSAAIHLSRTLQKIALFQFKLSLTITSTTTYFCYSHPKTMNWSMSSNCCTWEGVTCEHKTGNVIGLDLSCGGLEGAILPNNTLFQLSHLQFLDLSWNDFSLSNQFPQEFGFFAKGMTHLNLSYTRLSGSVPSGISHLYKLVSLDLSELTNEGEFPIKLEHEVFKSLLQNLTQLRVLNLEGVDISSVLPMNFSTSLRVLNLAYTGSHGELSQDVFHLPSLEVLDLSYNENLTIMLPKPKWGSSGSLQHLFLPETNLYGAIPDSVGFLESLATLVLSMCNLSGPIPRSIGNLRRLTWLDLSHNYLSGQIPNFVANYTNLIFLDLSDNNLIGSFPSFVDHPRELIQIDLSYNSLSGPLPSWLFELPLLTTLNIGYNGFTGQLHDFYSPKSQLQSFDCSNNLLNGLIPQSFSRLVNLTDLYFSSNNFSGVLDLEMFSLLESLGNLDLSHNTLSVRSTSMATLPPLLYHLGLSSCNMKEFPRFSRDGKIIGHLDLSHNQIDGEIPHWLALMGRESYPSYLNLSHNRLTGGLEQLPWNIRFLDLQSNMLNGSLPNLICNSSYLQILNLSHNNLSGVLPICSTGMSQQLSVFDLQMNNIHGSLPSTLSNSRFLVTLNLHGNKLEGIIPSSFAKFEILETLDLGSNQINDTFPQCLEGLQNLQVLVLKSNKFHGRIRKSSNIEHPFPNLRIIDLSNNEFSGPLPAIYFKNFKAIMNGDLNKEKLNYMGYRDYYRYSTVLVIKGREIELVRILTVYTTIDVSMNHFEGEIVEFIGNLVSLRFLNLSHNLLTGHIPFSIGNLSVLESLDLSFNRLEGEIPQQLTTMYSLARLNLSCNQLRGQIPKGPQFNTFENDSYVGNFGLCGHPLSKQCEHDIQTQAKEEDEDDDDHYFFSGFTWVAVVIGYGCGVVPAFITGYLMLLARKPKWFVGIIARELGLKIRRMEIKWR